MAEVLPPTTNPTLSAPQLSAQQVCANCKFWQNQRCHCHPPILFCTEDGEGGEASKFPLTKPDDWCGEHQFQTRVQDQLVVKQSYNLP